MADSGGVGKRAARAAIWAFLSTGGAKLITLAGLVVLARILAPREFGLLAFAMAYITYAETIGDLGSGMALVYWPDRRDDAAQVTFITNVVAGVFWTALTLLIAPAIADFFNAESGTAIVQVLAVSFLIKFLGNTHDALAQKDLRFAARAVPELGLAVLKAAIAIVLGYNGFGAWSLVWGHIGGLVCWTLFLWIVVPWRPSMRVPRDLFKPMLAYGRGIIALNVLSAVNHHADLAVVGRFAGVTVLGLYQMGSKVPESTVLVAIWALSRVLFPAFTNVAASGRTLVRPYLMAMRYLAAVTLPAGVGLALLAEPAVLMFFGTQWVGAAPIVAALSIHAAIRSLGNPPGDVLKATARAPLLAWLALFRAIFTVPALIIAAAFFGATAVAMTLAMVALVFTILTIVSVSRVIKLPLRASAAALAPSFFATGVMVLTLVLWNRFAEPFGAIAQITGGVSLGAIVYLAALRLADPEIVRRSLATLQFRRSVKEDLSATDPRSLPS